MALWVIRYACAYQEFIVVQLLRVPWVLAISQLIDPRKYFATYGTTVYFTRRQSLCTRAARGTRDNDIHKTLTALCKPCTYFRATAFVVSKCSKIGTSYGTEPTALKSILSARCGDVLDALYQPSY